MSMVTGPICISSRTLSPVRPPRWFWVSCRSGDISRYCCRGKVDRCLCVRSRCMAVSEIVSWLSFFKDKPTLHSTQTASGIAQCSSDRLLNFEYVSDTNFGPICTVIEAGWKLEVSNFSRREIVLCCLRRPI